VSFVGANGRHTEKSQQKSTLVEIGSVTVKTEIGKQPKEKSTSSVEALEVDLAFGNSPSVLGEGKKVRMLGGHMETVERNLLRQ
jgi:hypothetical protein